MAIEAVRTNAARLVRTRLAACIQPTQANRANDAAGVAHTLPGQGGVRLGVRLGDPASGFLGDHLEPGIALHHPDPAANRALQILASVGNRVTMTGGPAAGAEGRVYGKHGGVLCIFPQADLARMAPGEWAAVEAEGLGLAVAGEPDLVCHSCSPALLERLLSADGDRLGVPVRAVLPPEAASAGIGLMVQRYNIDLNTAELPVAALSAALRFGDIVAVQDQDHRYGREYREGWVAIGVICHGRCIAGGHGFGFMTLLSVPSARLRLRVTPEANVGRLLGWDEMAA